MALAEADPRSSTCTPSPILSEEILLPPAREPAGLLLDERSRPCGICGRTSKLSKTHVPPQAAGNTGPVERTDMMTGQGGYQAGAWRIGGMWVRGLCAECNSFAGAHYDTAYADFASQLSHWASVGSRAWVPGAQAVSLAPGRVTRSILSGMLGISPHVRELHPTLTAQMTIGGPVRLPGELRLYVAGYLGLAAQLTGPMLTALVDGSRAAVNTLAAVTFRPLTWALATSDSFGVLENRGWVDATDWLRYEDDRESVDLRWLAPSGVQWLPTVLHAPSDDGVTLYSKEIAPIMAGRIPR